MLAISHPFKARPSKLGFGCKDCDEPEGNHGNVIDAVARAAVEAAALAAQAAKPPAQVLAIPHPFKSKSAKLGFGCKDCDRPEGEHGVYVDAPVTAAVVADVPVSTPPPVASVPQLDLGPTAEWLQNTFVRDVHRTHDGGVKVCGTFTWNGVAVPICAHVSKDQIDHVLGNVKAEVKRVVKRVRKGKSPISVRRKHKPRKG